MTKHTFTEVVAAQTTVMLNVAKSLDEKGWALVMCNNAHPERYMHEFTYQGLLNLLWNRAAAWYGDGPLNQRVKPVIISLKAADPTRPLETMTYFHCRIPRRRHYKEIHSALSLMAVVKKRRSHTQSGNGPISALQEAEYTAYSGNDRTALEVFIRILDMPQHRKIMRGGV